MSPGSWLRLALMLLLLGAGWQANQWRNEAIEAARLRGELAAAHDETAAAIRRGAEQLRRRDEVTRAYHDELEAIRRHPVPRSPVRLCQYPPAVPGPAEPAGGAHAATAAAGSDSGPARADSEPGPDIGPSLRELAASAEVTAARLRALQAWAASSCAADGHCSDQ